MTSKDARKALLIAKMATGGYVPYGELPVARLAVAGPLPQQDQGGVLDALGSLAGLGKLATKVKDVVSPEPAATATAFAPVEQSNAEPSKVKEEAPAQYDGNGIPLPEKGYQPSGIYEPFQQAFDRMAADAPGAVTMYSGYRTPQRQAELWESALKKYGDPEVADNWVAPPGRSSHNYGLAADLKFADDATRQWVHDNAANYGLNFRMQNEDWHIEPQNAMAIRQAIGPLQYASGGTVADRLDKARAKVAIERAGGQAGPKSKFMPGVARAVHADGGAVNIDHIKHTGGNHPFIPDVVYHGTNDDFQTFERSKIGEDQLGFHVGHVDQGNHFASDDPGIFKRPNVMPLRIRMQNPLFLQDPAAWDHRSVLGQMKEKGILSEDEHDYHVADLDRMHRAAQDDRIPHQDVAHALADVIRSKGFDGVAYLNRHEGMTPEDAERANSVPFSDRKKMTDEEFQRSFPSAKHSFIALDPTQLKSATGNNGNYDPNDPDITKAKGGAVDDGTPDHILRGEDLKLGGDGMNGYYDNILPKAVSKLAKGYDPDVKLGTTNIAGVDMQSLPITDKIKSAVAAGQPAFARGGNVDDQGAGPEGLQGPGGIRGGAGVAQAPLEGLPTSVKIPLTGESLQVGPSPHIRGVAQAYMEGVKLPYNPPTRYARVDPARGARIADAYEQMQHNPSDPLTKASYGAMMKETMAQYLTAKRHGFKAEFWDPETEEDPYNASPRLAAQDVAHNNHMFVYPTESGYGTGNNPEDVANNPLLADSGERWNGKRVTYNDIFRAVHDYFGHAKEGVGFRADGEENAWRSHAAMYSPLARMAMTTETRGQNSWLNYGPHGEANKNARTEDTVFAPQKVGVMPHWAHHDGAEDFMRPDDIKAMLDARARFTGAKTAQALGLIKR